MPPDWTDEDGWYWSQFYPGQPSSTVERPTQPAWSGLYDSRGVKLYHPPNPVGFWPRKPED